MSTRKFDYIRDLCRICGAPATYSYYGATACQPCKVFFKRNADFGQSVLPCHFNGRCEINKTNRQSCPSCRLAKCFRCGMSADKFRASRSAKPKSKALTRGQRQNPPQRLSTLNLLQSDQSLLTTNQWILITNLFNCYKLSQVSSFTQRLISTHNVPPSTYGIYAALIDEFLVATYETVGRYLRSNNDLCHLSSDDRSIILRSAADNVTCIGGAFIMQHCDLYRLNTFMKIMNLKYGKQTMDIHVWARQFIDPDVIVVKLAISLFAFSENTCCYYSNDFADLTNPVTILEIQNKYAEITWKYLLYRYGYYHAVKRFLNLARWLTAMNILAVHAQTLLPHLIDIESIIEQTELSLVLDDVDRIMGTD